LPTPSNSPLTRGGSYCANFYRGVLHKLFEGDASSARPEGSMKVEKVLWWKHNSKAGQYSSARVHGSVTVKEDGTYELANLKDLVPEEIEGF
jgi:CRISPR-associated protein Csd2